MSLCPANVFGRYPSNGSRVYSRAVMSREVVRKNLPPLVRVMATLQGPSSLAHLESADHLILRTSS